jgi:hypothetical protein
MPDFEKFMWLWFSAVVVNLSLIGFGVWVIIKLLKFWGVI